MKAADLVYSGDEPVDCQPTPGTVRLNLNTAASGRTWHTLDSVDSGQGVDCFELLWDDDGVPSHTGRRARFPLNTVTTAWNRIPMRRTGPVE